MRSGEPSMKIESGKFLPGRLKSAGASLDDAVSVVRENADEGWIFLCLKNKTLRVYFIVWCWK